MGKKQDELDVHVQLQGCDLVGMQRFNSGQLHSTAPLPQPPSKGQNIMRRGLMGLDKDREITHKLQTWANQTQ